jgi:hypothetical protein
MRDEGGFPFTQSEAQIKELYGDLAWFDFNNVFKNQGEIINRQYGKTVNVVINITKKDNGGLKMSRIVKEDMALKNNEQEIFSKIKRYNPSEDLHL